MSEQRKRLAELRAKVLAFEIEYMRGKAQGEPPWVLSTRREMVRNHAILANELESQILRERAEWWGLEIPNKPEWQDEEYISEFGVDGKTNIERDKRIVTFNEKGRTIITRQIREAQLSYVEKWVKVLIPLLSLLVSAMSLLVAILAITKRGP